MLCQIVKLGRSIASRHEDSFDEPLLDRGVGNWSCLTAPDARFAFDKN
jgi:hypothetical protein